MAATGKYVIISTSIANTAELNEGLLKILDVGCQQLMLLKCTSTYPVSVKNSKVLIPNTRELFNCDVELSDHTLGVDAAVATLDHGANVIEKHFTLGLTDGVVNSDIPCIRKG